MRRTDSKEIRVIYGREIKKMTKELMASYKVEDHIPSKDSKIGLKPNLVIAAKPESGATTHMEIICGVIEYLQEKGFRNIIIIEGSWVGDRTERAFRLNGYDRVAEKYGVRLVDTKKDSYEVVEGAGIRMEVSETALGLDYLINLPVLKGHCQTAMTNALKNMKGLLSDRSKRMFHTLGLMEPIAALNTVIHGDITIVDNICGDLDFEEGGTPVETWRMMLGEDPVLIDSWCASLLGFDLYDVEYIPLAHEYGAGESDASLAEIIELNKPEVSNDIRPNAYAKRLASYTCPDSACSCCYANLIHALKRMEDRGTLRRLMGRKICIGQGWRGKEMDLGVGACCAKAKHGVVQCPPKAEDMIAMLENLRK